MATTFSATDRWSSATIREKTYTDMEAATYEVEAEGDMLFEIWNNGSTGSATITISSVAVDGWLGRTGDLTQAMATGESYEVLLPSQGFADNGKITFAVSGTGAADVDMRIIKNV